MRVALGALLLAVAFLAGVLAGVGAQDEPSLGAPVAIRVSAAATPGSVTPSGATPGVERIQREVEYEPIESYEDEDGSNSGPGSGSSGPGSGDSGSDSSGPGSGGSDSSGSGSDDSGSGSSGSGSSGSDSPGAGS
jgi:hypothetical protein